MLPENRDQNAGGTPETGGEQPAYVTKAEFDAFGENLKKLLGTNFQAIQSQTDRYQDKVQKQIGDFEKALAALRSQGVEVSQQAVDSAKTKILLDSLTGNEPDSDQGEEAEPPDALVSAYQETVTRGAEAIMKAAGVEITDEDPEVEIIEKAAEGPVDGYFEAVHKATVAKKERLEKEGQPNLGAIPSLSRGTGPSSNAIQNIMDPAQLFEIARKTGRIR